MNAVALSRIRLAEEALLAAAESDPGVRGRLRFMRAVVQVRLLLRDTERTKMPYPEPIAKRDLSILKDREVAA